MQVSGAVALSGLSRKSRDQPSRVVYAPCWNCLTDLVVLTSSSMSRIFLVTMLRLLLSSNLDHHWVWFHLTPLRACWTWPTLSFSCSLLSASLTTSATFHFLPKDTSCLAFEKQMNHCNPGSSGKALPLPPWIPRSVTSLEVLAWLKRNIEFRLWGSLAHQAICKYGCNSTGMQSNHKYWCKCTRWTNGINKHKWHT